MECQDVTGSNIFSLVGHCVPAYFPFSGKSGTVERESWRGGWVLGGIMNCIFGRNEGTKEKMFQIGGLDAGPTCASPQRKWRPVSDDGSPHMRFGPSRRNHSPPSEASYLFRRPLLRPSRHDLTDRVAFAASQATNTFSLLLALSWCCAVNVSGRSVFSHT